MRVFLYSSVCKWETQREQTFRYPKFTVISCYSMVYGTSCADSPNHHCSSVLFDERVNFLLVAFSCGSSRSTTLQLIGMLVYPALKRFTYLLTLLVSTQASQYTRQSFPQMSAGEFFSFTRNSITARLQNNVTNSHFVTVWIVGTCVVLMRRTCIHTGEHRCHY
jgi:hypothetical protein